MTTHDDEPAAACCHRRRQAFERGWQAEEIAARHYTQKGAVVLARRYRSPQGEIDLIVDEDGATVFVEVKARRRWPADGVVFSLRQQRRVFLAACCYLQGQPQRYNRPMRFDLALVDQDGVRVLSDVLVDEQCRP